MAVYSELAGNAVHAADRLVHCLGCVRALQCSAATATGPSRCFYPRKVSVCNPELGCGGPAGATSATSGILRTHHQSSPSFHIPDRIPKKGEAELSS